jgi:SAM-dependent methyltransferase
MTDELPRIFDPRLRVLHKVRAARLGGDRFLVNEALEGVRERLAPVNRHIRTALSLDEHAAANLQVADTAWQVATFDINEQLPPREPPGDGFDLAVSVLELHAVNDLPGALVQIRRALKPDGLFIGAVLGGATLGELRDSLAAGEAATTGGISPRVAPMADVRDLGSLLQRAGFAMPIADLERTTVRYRDFFGLVRDLRAMGETSALTGRLGRLRRDTLAATIAHYQEHHADPDGRLRATFDIVYLTGWAPHESQPKPLRPGSAKMRLADALGVKEGKL